MNTLILTPTELEAKTLSKAFAWTGQSAGDDRVLAVCGFGPVGAAVGTCQLLQEHSPDRVLLVGIAGSLATDIRIGNAYAFSNVTMHGVGILRNGRTVPPHELGFAELTAGSESDKAETGEFNLQTSSQVETLPQLLTVCQSLDSTSAAKQRGELFPRARVEDMEGYAVAMACSAQNIPLMIIRGISNVAGDRDKSSWQIDAALSSAAEAMNSALRAD